MIAKVTALRDEDSVLINLGEGMFEIKDTISDWLIVNSNEIVIGVFNKFSTVSIMLIEEVK